MSLKIVFILDDAESDREFIELFLSQDEQFDVKGFYDPGAFKSSLSDQVNLVIMDIRIPGYNYDIFADIEYIHDRFPGIYIIVISGFFDDDVYERLFELGVDRVVKKGTSEAWAKKVAKYVTDLVPKIELKQELMK